MPTIEVEGLTSVKINGLNYVAAAKAFSALVIACYESYSGAQTFEALKATNRVISGHDDYIKLPAFTGIPELKTEVKCGIAISTGRIYVCSHSGFPDAAPMVLTAGKWIELAVCFEE